MAESNHYYYPDGRPCYTVTGKNGKERPTTLRDARKIGLVPSVTTIIGCADKPGLMNWKIDQAILAALTCPRNDGEDEAEYLSRIKKDAQETARKAAERGTQIHGWIEDFFNGIGHEGAKPFYASVDKTVFMETGEEWWNTEHSFATYTYGGKCDLHTGNHLIDIKTTEKDISELKLWDEHFMQAAAYDRGIAGGPRRCGILYVNSINAESRLIWIEPDDKARGWAMFSSLLEYWYIKNKMEVRRD